MSLPVSPPSLFPLMLMQCFCLVRLPPPHEEHRAAVTHAVRHVCTHVLHGIWPEVWDVLERRENDGTAILTKILENKSQAYFFK